MAKRRQLKDAIADPMVEKRQTFHNSTEEKKSRSLQKIVIPTISAVVGVIAGALLNRYLKIF
jgi:F0F1-type ATP synthase assembly protein I